jgi:hypothetical protein
MKLGNAKGNVLCRITSVPTFVKIVQLVQKLKGRYSEEHGDLISLIFLKKESRLKRLIPKTTKE